METLIYGLARNENRDYMESLLSTNTRNDDDIKKVISAATAAGYHSFRITSYNGEKPNFANTLNI